MCKTLIASSNTRRGEIAGGKLATFRPVWSWCRERLPSRPGGNALDLDSMSGLHTDGHRVGVTTGHTRLGSLPCLNPLFAAPEEA